MSRKHRGKIQGKPITYPITQPAGGVQLETFIPWTLIKRGVKKQIITPIDAPLEFQEEAAKERQDSKDAQDSPLLRALGLAHHWQRLLDEGIFCSMTEIANAEGLDRGQVSKLAQLSRLAPDIVEACISGNALGLSLEQLIRRSIPGAWDMQRVQLSPKK